MKKFNRIIRKIICMIMGHKPFYYPEIKSYSPNCKRCQINLLKLGKINEFGLQESKIYKEYFPKRYKFLLDETKKFWNEKKCKY